MNDTANAFIESFTLEGAPIGPLAGLTFAAKDIFDVAGHITGCGNPDWARTHATATDHAHPVTTLLAAGAKLIGKTHTDEIAYSLMGANAHYGTPRNTHAPDRVPGGSSSGSAAATAAGLVDIGLGSDTGGSVRLPASFCGIYGIRTTHDRIPLTGTMPLAPSFDVAGWFARDAETFARGGQAFAIAEQPVEAVRLLLPVDAWALADPETVQALAPVVAAAQARFGSAALTRLSENGLAEWREVFRVVQASEIWTVHGAWVTQTQPSFGPGVRERFDMASKISETEAEQARTRRSALRTQIRSHLGADGILILPTSPAPAPKLNASEATLDTFRARALELLAPAGIGGLPQVSIPAATVSDGAPVGLSVVGPPGADGLLLSLARSLAQSRAQQS